VLQLSSDVKLPPYPTVNLKSFPYNG